MDSKQCKDINCLCIKCLKYMTCSIKNHCKKCDSQQVNKCGEFEGMEKRK